MSAPLAATDEALGRAADENLRSAAEAWALAAGGASWERPGVVAYAASVGLRSFNSAFCLVRPDLQALRELSAFFAGTGQPFRLRALESVLLDEATLREAGFEPQGGIPSLALSALNVPNGRDAGLEVRPVSDEVALAEHIDVVAEAFDWLPAALGRVFTARLLADERWRGYVGYVDGQAVAASQLFLAGQAAGIYYVATRAAHRRRGFGETMTRHAIGEGASSGATMACLQASPMGLPIYERMGFRQAGYYRTYVLKEA